jgi:hypothetical protein
MALVALVALAATLAATPALAQATAGESSAHREIMKRLVAAAIEQTHHVVRYDPAYVKIPYPGGDVPADTGVCVPRGGSGPAEGSPRRHEGELRGISP